MNSFDKCCVALGMIVGALLVLAGGIGLFFGVKAHFTLPPIFGVIPVFFGWGICRSVYIAWNAPKDDDSGPRPRRASRFPRHDPFSTGGGFPRDEFSEEPGSSGDSFAGGASNHSEGSTKEELAAAKEELAYQAVSSSEFSSVSEFSNAADKMGFGASRAANRRAADRRATDQKNGKSLTNTKLLVICTLILIGILIGAVCAAFYYQARARHRSELSLAIPHGRHIMREIFEPMRGNGLMGRSEKFSSLSSSTSEGPEGDGYFFEYSCGRNSELIEIIYQRFLTMKGRFGFNLENQNDEFLPYSDMRSWHASVNKSSDEITVRLVWK